MQRISGWRCGCVGDFIQSTVVGLSFAGLTFGDDFVGVTGIASSSSSSCTCM